MKRVLVIGGCGAGKSRFSAELSRITGLPLVHLDVLGWEGEWQKVSHAEFDRRLDEVLKEDAWVIDGNYARTIPRRLERADTVFWLDFSGIRCLRGVLERFIRNRGGTREDMGGNCRETLDRERLAFFRYALTQNKKIRPKIREALAAHPEVPVTVVKTRKEADKLLERLREEASHGME